MYDVQLGELEGIGEMRSQSLIGKDLYPISSNLFFKLLTEGAVEKISATINEKADPLPTAVARTLEYLIGVATNAATSRREKKTRSDQHPRDP